MEGIRYVVEGNSFRKDTFREAGVFIRIVTLLNNEHEKLPLFCEEVLKTLTCTLSENKRNKVFAFYFLKKKKKFKSNNILAIFFSNYWL